MLNIFYLNVLIWNIILSPLYIYLLLIVVDVIMISIRHKNILVGIATIPYIFLTHVYYGIRFIKGYFENDISASTHHKKSQ
jgi:hypothetical protein